MTEKIYPYIEDLLDLLEAFLLTKIETHIDNPIAHVSEEDRLKWDAGGSGGGGGTSDLALGETETTAYRGDQGKIAYDHSQSQHAPTDAPSGTTFMNHVSTTEAHNSDVTTHVNELEKIVWNSAESKITVLEESVSTLIQNTGVSEIIITNGTINADNWVGDVAPFTQIVSIPGIESNDRPRIYPLYSESINIKINEQDSWNFISEFETRSNVIEFVCFKNKPTTNVNFEVIVQGQGSSLTDRNGVTKVGVYNINVIKSNVLMTSMIPTNSVVSPVKSIVGATFVVTNNYTVQEVV